MNYSELQANIASFTERDDLTDIIPTFIQLAEARLIRDLSVADREGEATAATVTAEIELPADFGGLRTIHLATDPITVLEPMGLDALHREYLDSTASKPLRYAIESGNSLILRPEPDQEYTLNYNYYKRLPALSDAEPTNWLIELHPDAYLAATLVEAFAYQMDEQRAAFWEARLQGHIEAIKRDSARKARGGAPMRLKTNIPPLHETFDINRG